MTYISIICLLVDLTAIRALPVTALSVTGLASGTEKFTEEGLDPGSLPSANNLELPVMEASSRRAAGHNVLPISEAVGGQDDFVEISGLAEEPVIATISATYPDELVQPDLSFGPSGYLDDILQDHRRGRQGPWRKLCTASSRINMHCFMYE